MERSGYPGFVFRTEPMLYSLMLKGNGASRSQMILEYLSLNYGEHPALFLVNNKPLYYVLAFLIPLLITASAHYMVNLTGIDRLPANLFPENLAIPVIVLIVPYFIFILIAGGGQEEFGWRGYAQEPLQQRFGILGGSMLLGAAWGLWHLPLWFMPGEGHAYYSFFAFLIFIISMSVSIG